MEDHIIKRASEGKWIALYPFGYSRKFMDDGSVSVIIDDHQADIVRFIFELYISKDYSFSMIAEEVKSKYKEPMYKAKVENIIKKPFYYGFMKVKGALYPHSYGAIISEDYFNKAQDIAKNRRGTWVSPLNK